MTSITHLMSSAALPSSATFSGATLSSGALSSSTLSSSTLPVRSSAELSGTPPSSPIPGSSAAARPTPGAAVATEPTAEQKKAAQDFEAIFIRQLLSTLEKSSGLTGGESSGGAVFRSMMVGALADTAAEGGGIGMSELILRAMLPPAAKAGSEPSESNPELSAGEPSSQMGALPPSVQHPSVQIGSSRLGVAGRVLTQARSTTISIGRHPSLVAAPRFEEGGR